VSPGEVRRRVVVRHREGFHARPCSAIAALANRYKSRLRILRGEQEADGRSVFDLMMLTVGPGETVEVVAEGKDASALADAVAALIESDFCA
jgi:phosphotransferase system HPr (HPr) family protein